MTEQPTHDHHVGDLVVIAGELGEFPYGVLDLYHGGGLHPLDGMIGIVVDKVRQFEPNLVTYRGEHMLHVLWPDGITRARWDYQVLPLEE